MFIWVKDMTYFLFEWKRMVLPMKGTPYNTSIEVDEWRLRQDGMHLLCISFNLLEHVSIIIFSDARLFTLLSQFDARVKALQCDREPFIERNAIQSQYNHNTITIQYSRNTIQSQWNEMKWNLFSIFHTNIHIYQ